MKKTIAFFLLVILVPAMVLGLTACTAKEITFESKTINGLTVDVPGDFGEFTEKQGVMVAVNEKSTASIGVSTAQDAQGTVPADWDKDSFAALSFSKYTEITFIEFDTQAKVDGVPALYVHVTAKNSSGVLMESYSYLLYHDDGTFQSIAFSFGKDADTSLKTKIDTVKASIKIA